MTSFPHTARLSLAAASLFAVGLLAGCAAAPSPDQTRTTATPGATTDDARETATTPPNAGATSAGTGDTLAERDAFIAAQQQPLDGSTLAAVTEAQREFVAFERAAVEARGETWTPEHEDLVLRLTLDGCETAILNAHEVTPDVVRVHAETSPILRPFIPAEAPAEQRTLIERNLMSFVVTGSSYLCPADAEQWKAAFTEVYPGSAG